jgi:hypothetical protein
MRRCNGIRAQRLAALTQMVGALDETARHPYEGAVTGVEGAQARRDLDSLRRLLAVDDWPPDYLD